jgi:uncharacterized protein (TIRG00374 family)
LLLAVGVSAVCLYLATRGVDWHAVLAAIAGAHWGWVFVVVVISLALHVVRAERWRVLLRPVVHAPYWPALSATYIGFGASMVLPLRLGEIVRPALFARRVGIGLPAALSSVVVERIFDMLFVMVCFVLVALTYDELATYRDAAWGLAAALLVGTGALLILSRRRRWADAVVAWVTRPLPARVAGVVRRLAASLLDGMGGVGHGPTLIAVLVYSAILWGMIAMTYLCSFLALDVQVPLVSASLAAVVVVAFFVFLPQAPGYVGTWQAGCVVALGLFAVPRDLAVSYAFLTWLVQMVVNIGAGAACAAFEDLSFRTLLPPRS